MKKTIFLFFCTLSVHVFAQTGQEPVQVTDLLKIKTAGNIVVSDDGSKAIFTVASIEPDEKKSGDYKYLTQLYLVGMNAPSAPVQLTHGSVSSFAPAISPDGKNLAFVRVADGRQQVFILPLNGGEAWQLTKSPYGAGNPVWSPDGSRIIFTGSVQLKDLLKDSVLNPSFAFPLWPMEKPGMTVGEQKKALKAQPNPNGNLDQIRAYLLKDEAEGKATVLTKLNFQDESGVTSSMGFTQFFSIKAQPSAEAKPILTGFSDFHSVAFTPDGKKLVITADIDSLEHPDRSLESEIYMADADGKNLKMLLGQKGIRFSSARVSPSGKWLAYLYGPVEDQVPALAVMPLNGTPTEAMTIAMDRTKSNLSWSNDDRFLYFTAQSNGGAPLYRASMATKTVEQLTDAGAGITSFGLGRDNLLFSKTEVSSPSDVYVADINGKYPRPLTHLNEWVKNKKLSVPEKKSFVNEKGLTVEYWVMKPATYTAGKKYPLLLEIHGGPSAMWGPGEASMWHEFQYFTSQGYGVVYSNPRGSGGYGEKFLRANVADWGTGPSSDVLTALDKAVAEGWADTSKLLITGGSYAGYLTAWIIAHDHRFKAACSQRGVYDLATFFGEGNAWRLVPNYFGGYPWEPKVKELLQRESPITYVQNIKTPYIIFHGDNDRRTGFVQGEMLYRSLKVLGRPVEYVRHPGATHEITRSGDNRQRIDQLLRTYEFFERWLH